MYSCETINLFFALKQLTDRLSPKTSQNILLIDLPTFPKGVISLSLLSVASRLIKYFNVKIDDMSLLGDTQYVPSVVDAQLYGLKVSAQNYSTAISLSIKIKILYPNSKIIWGGELPSLLPNECLEYADAIVCGLFDPIADELAEDLKNNALKRVYKGANVAIEATSKIQYNILPHPEKYYTFMGWPLETSRGCTEKCIFCMVHTMQKKNYNMASYSIIQENLNQLNGRFINVIDYNFGVNRTHVIEVSKLIKNSGALGWMAEMCIDLLDDDELLASLRDSNCKMIYCGLESIDQRSLNSIHKMNTNHIQNYERIIRKAQNYNVQIAAGIILGIEGTNENTFIETFDFYQKLGIIYAKLTFLTYNPGTKAHDYEKRKGQYTTGTIDCFDGNQLTFLPNGVNLKHVKEGTIWFIKRYYSVWGIVKRSFNTKLNLWARLEFILFNLCYRHVYMDWLKHEIIYVPENLKPLISRPFNRSILLKLCEVLLQYVRKKQIK